MACAGGPDWRRRCWPVRSVWYEREYEAALRLLPAGAEHDERRLLLLGAQGQALASAGRPADARDILRRVLAMLPRDAAEQRVRVVEALADLEALWLHDPEEARRDPEPSTSPEGQ